MNELALTVTMRGPIEEVAQRVAEAIKPAGFGILTRIDFDKKIKEKTGETLKPCVILGACNPLLAHEAYCQSTDAALLIPCNIVLTEVVAHEVKVEAMRPTQMLNFLPNIKKSESILQAEAELKRSLEQLAG